MRVSNGIVQVVRWSEIRWFVFTQFVFTFGRCRLLFNLVLWLKLCWLIRRELVRTVPTFFCSRELIRQMENKSYRPYSHYGQMETWPFKMLYRAHVLSLWMKSLQKIPCAIKGNFVLVQVAIWSKSQSAAKYLQYAIRIFAWCLFFWIMSDHAGTLVI